MLNKVTKTNNVFSEHHTAIGCHTKEHLPCGSRQCSGVAPFETMLPLIEAEMFREQIRPEYNEVNQKLLAFSGGQRQALTATPATLTYSCISIELYVTLFRTISSLLYETVILHVQWLKWNVNTKYVSDKFTKYF